MSYFSPPARRIFLISHTKEREKVDELFIQRKDAFVTNLISSINRLEAGEISEIRYTCGIDDFVRIYVGNKGETTAEYSSRSRKSIENLRVALGLPGT